MIIAFTGKAGVGKSTAIDALKTVSGGRAVCGTKFAAPLYQIQEQIYRIVAPAYQRPPDFVKDRALLQWIGTEWGRGKLRESIWVDLWKARVDLLRSRDADLIVACDDCRFDNEAEAVKSIGGVIVRLTSKRDTAVGGIPNHASEAGIDAKYIDYTLTNDGSVEEFQAALKALFAQIQIDLSKPVTEELVFEEDDFLSTC